MKRPFCYSKVWVIHYESLFSNTIPKARATAARALAVENQKLAEVKR